MRWHAQEHMLCLPPAFIIAGAISVFISQGAVMKYLAIKANKLLAHGRRVGIRHLQVVCAYYRIAQSAGDQNGDGQCENLGFFTAGGSDGNDLRHVL